MSDIADFASSIANFYSSNAVEQLIILAWFVETRQGRSSFDSAYLRQCFREVGVEPPDMSVYLPRLAAKAQPQLYKVGKGYRLAADVRRTLDVRFKVDEVIIKVAKTLSDLPTRIPDIAEREFLTEALSCYRARAYRATIIMVWNLAYDHLLKWVFADVGRTSLIAHGVSSRWPKKNLVLTKREDVEDLKESEFIEAARTIGVIDKNMTQILREKLNRRNMAAHPSSIKFSQQSADEMILDLVDNVILRLL